MLSRIINKNLTKGCSEMDRKAFIKYISALLLFGLNGIVASHIPLSSYEIVFLEHLSEVFY